MSAEPVWFDFPADRVVEQMEFINPVLDMIHRISVIDASAAILERMLERNTLNRGKKRTEIARMTNDIASGEWDFNGNTFVFASTGRLLDGQNRATAIINSGADHVLILVVEGLPESAGDSIDQGVRRRPIDILALQGIDPPYKTIVVSIANILTQASVTGGRFYSAEQIANYAKENLERFVYVASWAKGMSTESPLVQAKSRRNSRSLAPGALGALTIYMIDNGASLALWEKFIKAVATGLALDERTLSAATAMRKRIINNPLMIASGGDPYPPLLLEMGAFIHTYNRWVKGDEVQVVKEYTRGVIPKKLSDLPKPVRATSVIGESGLGGLAALSNNGVVVPDLNSDAVQDADIHQGLFGTADTQQ